MSRAPVFTRDSHVHLWWEPCAGACPMLRRIARRARGTDRGLGAPRKPTRYVSGNGIRRAIVTRSELSRLGQVKYALVLLAALATSGAIRAHAAGAAGGTICVIAYPFDSSDPRTS